MITRALSIQIVLRLNQQPTLPGEIEVHGLLQNQTPVAKATLLS
jgi:hypothetical protein